MGAPLLDEVLEVRSRASRITHSLAATTLAT
jgi:hypothetical protein